MSPGPLTVRVPATTANLGPGFDCLGMALDLHNEVTLERSERFEIVIRGEGEGVIPEEDTNLVLQAAQLVHRRVGAPISPFRIDCENGIPLARGLGSSAAAVVGGLVAANHLLGCPLSVDDLLELGTALEGHPDNVTPALLGGCRVVVQEEGRLIQSSVPLPQGLGLALFIPDFEMPTAEARRVLPKRLSRADAVYNIGRTALLVAVLSQGRWELLRVATQDRLHQAARGRLFPAMSQIFEAALEAGAAGVFLSGAGPTVLALTIEKAEAIAQAMAGAAASAGVKGRTLVSRPSVRGAYLSTEAASSSAVVRQK